MRAGTRAKFFLRSGRRRSPPPGSGKRSARWSSRAAEAHHDAGARRARRGRYRQVTANVPTGTSSRCAEILHAIENNALPFIDNLRCAQVETEPPAATGPGPEMFVSALDASGYALTGA
jgi:hypothetical protein